VKAIVYRSIGKSYDTVPSSLQINELDLHHVGSSDDTYMDNEK